MLGALVALLAVTGLGFTACSDNEPANPSISGDSPAEVTVPTLPPTTTEATGSTVADEGNVTPTTVDAADNAEGGDTTTTLPGAG